MLARCSREVRTKDPIAPYDLTANSFLDRYVSTELCSDQLAKEIAQAKELYCYAYDSPTLNMEPIVAKFARPLGVGFRSIELGAAALMTKVHRIMPIHSPLDYCEAEKKILELNTSPGWPWTQIGYHTRKALKLAVNMCEVAREVEESGLHTLWTCCMKSEVLKREKFLAGNLRLFCVCPMQIQLILLKYSAFFNEFIERASVRGEFPCYVGVSPLGLGWHRVFFPFTKAAVVFSLDETNWDTSLHYLLFEKVYRIRQRMLKNVPRKKIDWLVDEIVNTFLVTDTGVIIRKTQGNPSGSSNTCIDNSCILIMIYYEAYFRVYPHDTLEDFEKYVNLSVLGDDNICGVASERALFGIDSVTAVMTEWGIIPKVESNSTSVCGAEYLSKVVGVYDLVYYKPLVPLPKRIRFLAHYLYSNPGANILLSAIKCNSLMLEGVFHKDLWDMLQTFQYWYRDKVKEMCRWETEDVTIQSFIASIFPRSMILSAYIGYPELDRSHNMANLYKKIPEEMPRVTRLQQKAKKIHTVVKKAWKNRKETAKKVHQASNVIGSVTSKIVPLVRNIPVVGQVAQAVDFAANTVVPFLSSLFGQVAYLHITSKGKRMLVKHSHIRYEDELKEGTPVPAGTILMKMPVSIGPEDSRCRIAGSNFEKVSFKHYTISVEPNAPATEPGSLLYVYVPDPLDHRIEEEPVDNRLTIAMAYQKQLKLQLFARGDFTLTGGPSGIPKKQYYIHDDTGSERLTTPGVIYVLAASEIDMSLLPTIRLKTGMGFSQSAVKSNYDVDIRGRLNFIQENDPNGSLAEYTAACRVESYPSDWDTGDRLYGRITPGFMAGYKVLDGVCTIVCDTGILLKKGEIAHAWWNTTTGAFPVYAGRMRVWPAANLRPTISEINDLTQECVVETLIDDRKSANGLDFLTVHSVITAKGSDMILFFHRLDSVSDVISPFFFIEASGAIDPNLVTLSTFRRLFEHNGSVMKLKHPSSLFVSVSPSHPTNVRQSSVLKQEEEAVMVNNDRDDVKSISLPIVIPRPMRR